MKKRFKMSKGNSRKKFQRSAGTKRINMAPRPMRGGTRL